MYVCVYFDHFFLKLCAHCFEAKDILCNIRVECVLLCISTALHYSFPLSLSLILTIWFSFVLFVEDVYAGIFLFFLLMFGYAFRSICTQLSQCEKGGVQNNNFSAVLIIFFD